MEMSHASIEEHVHSVDSEQKWDPLLTRAIELPNSMVCPTCFSLIIFITNESWGECSSGETTFQVFTVTCGQRLLLNCLVQTLWFSSYSILNVPFACLQKSLWFKSICGRLVIFLFKNICESQWVLPYQIPFLWCLDKRQQFMCLLMHK